MVNVMDEMDELLSTVDVGKLAGVGPTAVKRWADQGVLPCVKTAGGHRRFERREVQKFLEATRGSSAASFVDLLLQTDGLIEAQNQAREFYGEERVQRLLHSLDVGRMTARQIRDALLADVQHFAGSAHQHDDMTVVVVKIS